MHPVNSLICAPNKYNRNHFWPQWIRRGRQILPKKNNLCAHLHHLCFIVLCYKGRKDTIVPGGSQFTRYNLSVSLCLKERRKWKIRSDLFCVARYNSSWERVNQPLFVFRPQTEFMSFFSYFNYNSAVFQRNNLTRQIALIQCSGRSKHTLPFHNKL